MLLAVAASPLRLSLSFSLHLRWLGVLSWSLCICRADYLLCCSWFHCCFHRRCSLCLFLLLAAAASCCHYQNHCGSRHHKRYQHHHSFGLQTLQFLIGCAHTHTPTIILVVSTSNLTTPCGLPAARVSYIPTFSFGRREMTSQTQCHQGCECPTVLHGSAQLSA